MKILKVNYMPGEARFVIEGFPNTTFVVELKTKVKKKDVIDSLLSEIGKIYFDNSEQKYTDFKLKSLEGTDL